MNLALLCLALFAIVGGPCVRGRENFINKGHEGFSKYVIKTREGDVVDCVDIHKQASLNHPSLKNHDIQMNPSWMLDADIKSSVAAPNTPEYGLTKPCPRNTVPIPRARGNLELKLDTSDQHRVYVAYDDEVFKYGAGAFFNVYNLSVAPDQFSSHNIWVQADIGGHLSMIIAGWRVNPQLFGDGQPRFFTYWTGDNYRNGCYNTLCAGFVQVGQRIYPGMAIYPTSTYGGIQFGIRIDIKLDKPTGNWWLMFDHNIPIGYWPKQLFKSLGGGATLLSWGGVGKAGKDGICPPLGNGHFPDSDRKALYIGDLEYVDSSYKTKSVNDVALKSGVDRSGCYGLQQLPHLKYDNGASTYYLLFGGPGGCHCGS